MEAGDFGHGRPLTYRGPASERRATTWDSGDKHLGLSWFEDNTYSHTQRQTLKETVLELIEDLPNCTGSPRTDDYGPLL